MPDVMIGAQRLRYQDTGGDNRPVIVFSHAFGMNGSMFEPQLAAFSSSARCITWDERAHGASPTDQPFTFWDSAHDLLGLLDHLGVESAYLVGTSQGGFLSMRAALLAPHRVKAMMVLGSSAAAEDPAQRAAFTELHDAFVADPAGPPDQVIDAIAHVSLGDTFDGAEWKAIWKRWPAQQFSFAFNALVERDSILDRLGEITTPTYVMHGTDDNSYAPAQGEAIAAGLAQCEGFSLIEGGAHFLSLTNPEPVNADLAALIRKFG